MGRATAKPTIYLNEKVGFVPLPTLRSLNLLIFKDIYYYLQKILSKRSCHHPHYPFSSFLTSTNKRKVSIFDAFLSNVTVALQPRN